MDPARIVMSVICGTVLLTFVVLETRYHLSRRKAILAAVGESVCRECGQCGGVWDGLIFNGLLHLNPGGWPRAIKVRCQRCNEELEYLIFWQSSYDVFAQPGDVKLQRRDVFLGDDDRGESDPIDTPSVRQ